MNLNLNQVVSHVDSLSFGDPIKDELHPRDRRYMPDFGRLHRRLAAPKLDAAYKKLVISTLGSDMY